MFTFLLLPNSDRVMIHLGSYNCAFCRHTQTDSMGVCTNRTIVIPQLNHPLTSPELGTSKDTNKLAESVNGCAYLISLNQAMTHFWLVRLNMYMA